MAYNGQAWAISRGARGNGRKRRDDRRAATRYRAITISPPISSRAISTPAAAARRPSSTIAAPTPMPTLAERVERFGHALRALGMRREERMLMCLTDTIDWPTAFLGAIKAGVVAVPVNTLMTEDDYASCCETAARAAPRRLRRTAAEIRQRAIAALRQTSRTCHCLRRERARPSALRRSAGRKPRPIRSRRRRRATTWASGSTPPARPASRRARCIRMPI